ncbi:RAMP superfamily CRISPR-associated protein [Laspinema sp. D1]|uniref:RAMP superfamily CRISPR-associated protein n=1 Tax=Laspinema palackyanum D2a TaxID=2953684 RepID=A0ABT2MK21_9CYAN|nr:RAMP superfamily CRISPR-associated protein [Laspinema sp. D2a]
MSVKSEVQWLICREPVHIGGADSSSRGNNNPIYRLPDRTPAIPGSSLRGALRERAQNEAAYADFVDNWFGREIKPKNESEEGEENKQPSDNESGDEVQTSPGYISLSWGWPVWWPIHVLGYGNWWISCPSWLNRVHQLTQSGQEINLSSEDTYITSPELDGKDVYLRWLKLENVKDCTSKLNTFPAPREIRKDNRMIVVSDNRINLMVDMGLVRQPRVSLRDEPDSKGSLVNNLFAVEGLPPGAVFIFAWTFKKQAKVENPDQWPQFLKLDHYLGGLWSVGYGRISILKM